MQHTGLVVAVDDTYVYTMEGNTSSDSGVVWNGGSVNNKKYKLTYERIAGYGRPDYANLDPDEDLNDETAQESKENETVEVKDMYIGTAIVTPKTGKGVNFRCSPSKTAGRVVGCLTIPAGETVNVKSTDGTWAAIEYKGYTGYMMVEFLAMSLTEAGGTATEGEGTERTVEQIVSEIMKLVEELAAKAK